MKQRLCTSVVGSSFVLVVCQAFALTIYCAEASAAQSVLRFKDHPEAPRVESHVQPSPPAHSEIAVIKQSGRWNLQDIHANLVREAELHDARNRHHSPINSTASASVSSGGDQSIELEPAFADLLRAERNSLPLATSSQTIVNKTGSTVRGTEQTQPASGELKPVHLANVTPAPTTSPAPPNEQAEHASSTVSDPFASRTRRLLQATLGEPSPQATPSPLVLEEYAFTSGSTTLAAAQFDAMRPPQNSLVDAPANAGCENCLTPHACAIGPGQSGTQSICGVDCGASGAPCCSTWHDAHCIPWSLLGPGEYVGPARSQHVSTYYLRVNDLVTLTYIISRKKNAESYQIGVGDQLRIEWLQRGPATGEAGDASLNREVLVQPDGTITAPLVGEVMAAGKTIQAFREEITDLYSKFQRDPQITVSPITVNIGQDDVIKAVTSQSRSAGQALDLRITPEGTIQAPGIGSVFAQGLTLDELQNELEARYAAAFGPGLLVSPALTERAVSYVFLGGEVRSPGRYTLEGPTTVMQAIALAGGWNNGGNLREVVIFRRDENWCLKATKIEIRKPLYGNDPCPVNDVWLRENDLVIVPKSRILCATDVIELYFTRGVYAVFPITYVKDFSSGNIVPVP